MTEKIDQTTETNSAINELLQLIIKYNQSVKDEKPDINIRLELEPKLGKFLQKSNIDQIVNFLVILLKEKGLNTP